MKLTEKKLLAMSVAELEEALRHHNHLYWDRDTPELSDYDFDRLVRRLQDQAPGSKALLEMGPTGHEPGSEVRHQAAMLSLDKCYGDEDLLKWAASFTGDVVAMPKLDGIACSIHYSARGDLTLAATRGDGFVGDDITRNVREIQAIPRKVRIERAMEVRGEIFMRLTVFEKYRAEGMANPRNLTAGAIKQKDPKKSAAYNLSFMPYDLLGTDHATLADMLRDLEALGFPAIDWVLLSREKVVEGYAEFAKKRPHLDYEIDGVVLKANLISEQRRLGQTSHHPRYALAYKFQGDSGASILRAVEWSVARTGAITPVAIVDPVVLSGVTVTRASLHHAGFIEKLGLTLGAEVILTRRGGVIPNVELLSKPGTEPVVIPTHCPACGSPVRAEKDFLYCSEPGSCTMAAIGRLGHYAAVTDMKGFGDAILEQAYAAGFLRSPADFYSFTWEQIAALEKCGEKLGRKLVAEVDKKRTLDLATFLRALGLGELGKHVSKILAKQYPSLDAVLAVTEPELAAIHSIGDIIARAVVAGLKESSALITELRKHVTIAVSQAPSAGSAPGVAASGPFAGQSFVFTGKMASLERKAAAAQVEELGGVAADSVSRTLSYLVVGDDKSGAKSTKEKAAEKLLGDGGALKVISETEFLKMVESARDRG